MNNIGSIILNLKGLRFVNIYFKVEGVWYHQNLSQNGAENFITSNSKSFNCQSESRSDSKEESMFILEQLELQNELQMNWLKFPSFFNKRAPDIRVMFIFDF